MSRSLLINICLCTCFLNPFLIWLFEFHLFLWLLLLQAYKISCLASKAYLFQKIFFLNSNLNGLTFFLFEYNVLNLPHLSHILQIWLRFTLLIPHIMPLKSIYWWWIHIFFICPFYNKVNTHFSKWTSLENEQTLWCWDMPPVFFGYFFTSTPLQQVLNMWVSNSFWIARILFCSIARFDTMYLISSVLVTFDSRLRTSAFKGPCVYIS